MPAGPEQRSANAPRPFWLLALFALGVLSSLAQLLYGSGIGFGRYFEPMSVARNLVKDHTFANPFTSAPTGPTAHVAPVYPAVVAGVLWLFGDTGGTAVPLILLAACLCGLHAALLPVVSSRLIGSPRAGAYAALLSIALPVMELQPQLEANWLCT